MQRAVVVNNKLYSYILIQCVLAIVQLEYVKAEQHIPVCVTDKFPAEVCVRVTKPIERGAILRVRASGIHFLTGVRVDEVCTKDGKTLEVVHRFNLNQLRQDWTWSASAKSMMMFRTENRLDTGSELTIKFAKANEEGISGDKNLKVVNVYSGLVWSMQIVKIQQKEATEFDQVSEKIVFDFVSGKPDHFDAYLRNNGHLKIVYYDVLGNPTIAYKTKLSINAGGQSITAWTTENRSVTDINIPTGIERVEIHDSLGKTTVSNALPRSIDTTPIWFGDIHWHTEFSGDGQRDLESSLISARDELSLDFVGPSDHISHQGKFYNGLTPENQSHICERFQSPGRFIIIAGVELSDRNGHADIFADSFEVLMAVTKNFSFFLPQSAHNIFPHSELTQLCPPKRALYIPHHTNADSFETEKIVDKDGRPVWCPMSWQRTANYERLRLFEMCQGRGSFETEDKNKDWGVEYGGYGSSVQSVLLRGYRVGFVGGSDNHAGWPTRGVYGPVGLTAVQASGLTPASLFESLYNKRCYATSGARIIADATLNDRPIGSELRLRPGEPRKFKICIKGTAPLKKVQIIQFGVVLADFELNGEAMDFTTEWIDSRPGRPLDNVYYYVRALQIDGHRVWLSPWWVDLLEN